MPSQCWHAGQESGRGRVSGRVWDSQREEGHAVNVFLILHTHTPFSWNVCNGNVLTAGQHKQIVNGKSAATTLACQSR